MGLSNNILSKRTMLNSLTSFRFFAVLLVFIFHVGILSKYQTGYVGVSFFFILSGFILTYNYKLKFKHELDIYEVKKFYIARIAKIYPIHILTFFFAVPYYFFIPLKHEPILYIFQAITNLTLIHSFIPFGNISFNGVSWSLSNELFFYVLFPFLIFIVLKYFTIKRMIFVAISLWLIFIGIFLFILPQNSGFITWLSYYFPGVRVFEFIIGIILGLLFFKVKEKGLRLSKLVFSLLEISSIFSLIIIIVLSPSFTQNLRYSLIYIPLLSSIIFIYAFQKGIFSNFLSKKLFVYLGEISFSFYMIHNIVLSYIYFLWKPNIPSILLIFICLILSIGLSSLLYHLFEEPMRIKVRGYLLFKLEQSRKVRSNREGEVLVK